MDVLLEQRQANQAKYGNNLWSSLSYSTNRVANGVLQEVRTGTGIAVHALEHAVEQPISLVRGLGTEIKDAVVAGKNTVVHLAILGFVGYFAWEFIATEQVLQRTGEWVEGLMPSKRRRRIY